MALVVEGNETDVCNSWEDIEDNAELLDKQLARLKLEKTETDGTGGAPTKELSSNSSANVASITLDSTTQESLRTQYTPPEPKLKILARPKETTNTQVKATIPKQAPKTAPPKSLQQREQEYAAARMRILGDVRFEAEEAEAEMEATLSPAEILKLKVAEAVRSDTSSTSSSSSKSRASYPASKTSISATSKESYTNGLAQATLDENFQATNPVAHENGLPRRNKRSREKIKTMNPEPIRDFPVPKTDLDRIIRHPRGPDGSTGFTSYRS